MTQHKVIPGRIHFAAIGLVSLSMMAVQILVTRIFSVTFYYHFAFAGIAFAMLGLTAGAFKVYHNPARYTPASLNAECARSALLAAVLFVLSTLIMVDACGRLRALLPASDLGVNLSTAMFFIGPFLLIRAFVSIGVCVTLLLTYFPAHTSRLYAADLISAALGCVLVVVALTFLDPVSIILLLGVALSLLAWKLAREVSSGERRAAGIATLVLSAFFALQAATYFNDAPFFHLRVGNFQVMQKLAFERWNSFTHVGVHAKLESNPFGWGFGSRLRKDDYKDVEQHRLRIDANAATLLTKFDGDLDKVGYLKYDVVNAGYLARDIGHVAVIGVGGGRDILSALTFDAKKITGIEINPAIFEALNVAFADFTGHLSSYPQVELVNAEARSYISSHETAYDLIQISLIDTWAATAAGGLTLSENRLYTIEAWNEFFNHLNPKGMLAVSRWFVPGTHQDELYRMLSLAADSLKAVAADSDIRKHVIALYANQVVTLLVSKSPFTEDEIARLAEQCERYGFEALITPSKNLDELSSTLLSGKASRDFYDSLHSDLTSPTDDRPFFFNMIRLRDALFLEEQNPNTSNNVAVYVLLLMAVLVFLYLAYAVIWPMAALYRSKRRAFSGSGPFILYFVSIGLGFMFVEMALMQWLTVFLGHPVYALSVILFTMLLFSGIGSYTVNAAKVSGGDYLFRPAALCLLLAATLGFVGYLRTGLIHYDTAMRITLSVLLLMPVSLFLGMMFPLGVAAAKKQHGELLPWFWALNGTASVFASVFSVVISMKYGASATYASGLACYVLCFFVCVYLRRKSTYI